MSIDADCSGGKNLILDFFKFVLPFDPEILLLEMYSNKMKYVCKDSARRTFIITLCIIAK